MRKDGIKNVRVDGYDFTATPMTTNETAAEIVRKWHLTPKGTIPANHKAGVNPELCEWGENYTFYDGQTVYGIGKESVEVEWLG